MSSQAWWREGVLYQIYPRSFADSNGDGVGDLQGLIGRLDHLEWLGVDGIWLNPTMPSPNDDWGYDVADYVGVHPELGTLEDLDALVAAAEERGIRVLLDLVPNHSSSEHAWFADAVTGRDAEFRDYYVWAEPGPDGGPPNNWESNFGGSAWQWHEPTGQYYLNNFLPTQPDLNWWNEDVRVVFDDVLRFWFDRGIAGFRIDVCHAIVKDRELRDDPAVTPADHPEVRRRAVKQVFSMNRPEVHDVLRRWRAIADGHDPRAILVGETYVLNLDSLMPYYGNGEDELNLAFNFLFVHAGFDAADLRTIVEGVEAKLPHGAWPVWTGSNHDAGRFTTRWAADDPRRSRLALLMLLTLRGTPFLYYGDELGLPEVQTDWRTALDPVARRTGDPSRNRDGCRTPMPWSAEPGGGFTPDGTRPWLPFGDLTAHNVADQAADRGSQLWLTRDLIALRREEEALRTGAYAVLETPADVWAWRRGDAFVAALNLSAAPAEVAGVTGTVEIGTDRARDGEAVDGTLALGPWEGALVRMG
jgi:alpha-glucosidase